MPSRKRKTRSGKRAPKASPANEKAKPSVTDSPAQRPFAVLNLPLGSGAAALRQVALVQLQRDLGNRWSRQLVSSLGPSGRNAPVVQRDPLDQPLTGLGTPLVGLKRGDGLELGTFDKRERVRLLQNKLNEKMIANIKEDGMFGPRTEEVLGEFQESVDLAPSSVVDPVTADLLMSEGEPLPTPGPGGELPHPRLVSGGASLNSASISLIAAGISIFACGSIFSGSFNPSRAAAASQLFAAEGILGTVSGHLASAGVALAVGDHVGIRTAGEQLVEAGRNMLIASIHISGAGTALLSSLDGSFVDAPAGGQIIEFAKHLEESGIKVEEAGIKLQEHADRRTQVGDPIVGLRKGDGLIFGTFNRRDRVRILQGKLNGKIGAGLEVDGMFGPLTTAALQELQASEGLPVTERVDSATAKALRDASETGDEKTPIELAGESLSEAGQTLSIGSIFLNAAGNILMSGSSPEDIAVLAPGEQLVQASAHFDNTGDAFSSAGSDLENI